MQHDDRNEGWAQRISSEFAECPALRVTAAQAARFWGLERARAEAVLDELVRRAVLVRSPDGVFMRPAGVRRLL